MEVHRWHTLAALVCSLSLQAVALAQKVELPTTLEKLVAMEADPKNPEDKPPAEAKEKPVERRARVQQANPEGLGVHVSEIKIHLPNGETRVIRVPTASGVFALSEGGGDEASEPLIPKYVIGVSLSEVPNALRAHVNLPEGVRVMAGSVFADSPAAKAGLLQYDLLLKSGDKELRSPKDLQEIVDASEGQPVSITLQRKGEQKTIEVTPLKREDAKFAVNSGGPLHLFGPDGPSIMISEDPLTGSPSLPPGLKVKRVPITEMMAPGMIMSGAHPNQVQALTDSIRQLSEQVERLKESIDKLEKQQSREEAEDRR
jgi:PDZ domain